MHPIVLRPCPFCGGEAKAYEYKADKVTFGMVMCTLCGVKGDGESPSKAAEWWNTRVDYEDAETYRAWKRGFAEAHKASLGKDNTWDSRNPGQ
jgi:Lar family restriction alleviation protein